MTMASLQSRGYLPVATASLYPAAVLDCDLYLQRKGSPYAELYRGRNYPLEIGDVQRLQEEGIDHLYVRLEDADAYRIYLCEHVLKQQQIPAAARAKALREVARVAFEHALAAKGCDEMVQLATTFGRDLATVMADQSIEISEFFSTLEHDYYTFTHVCNVSIYCVMLALRMGLSDKAQISELATGALLHDVGKRHIPPHVLNKPDKLTDAEWEVIREHPATGFRDLVARDDLTWAQLMMVYQHHERLDGTGYPAGIVGEEIHSWARLCAVVDVFDALTCDRPYRRAVPVPEVCDYLAKYSGVWFDAEAVKCWTAHMRSAT
jgi:HD-GYP domain-containing protein (c-di-GMP phosphodiesterase class II)